jgi:glycerol-3-phosphate dehydrogenase
VREPRYSKDGASSGLSRHQEKRVSDFDATSSISTGWSSSCLLTSRARAKRKRAFDLKVAIEFIRPRKGQFVVFDKTAFGLAPRILFPVPSARTKGVVVGQSAFGNLIVGPTAEDQDERRIATVEEAALAALIAEGSRIVPALAHHSVTAVYAGLRPATEFKDYQIEALPKERWITVGGIRSTGLTASLGIARHVRELHEDRFGALAGRDSAEWTPAPNLAEDRPRAYQQNGRSAIVCHCELVTEREIEAAFEDPLPVATLGGLRRRTRCMMGRCQGFYCTRRISEIAAGRIRELPEPTANRRNNG